MKKLYLLAALFIISIVTHAQESTDANVICENEEDSIQSAVIFPLDTIVFDVDTAKYWPLILDQSKIKAATQRVHPVFFKLFSQGTLYGDAVRQAVSCNEDENMNDPILIINNAINRSLIQSFVNAPWLFTTTQTAISDQKTLGDIELPSVSETSQEVITPVNNETPVVIDDNIELNIVAEKPNFWKFDGSGSVQFSQNHFSDNWFQGGESNYTMLSLLKLHVLYDNKQKIQWETVLDAKLGFQTVENDDYRKFRTNNDQLRLTTKFGYKASKRWFYTIQAEATTQITRSYTVNSPDVVSDFMSPLKTVLSVGMDYKFEWKKLRGSAYMSPVAMTWMYVDRLALATRYGNDENSHSRVTWGPFVKVDYTWEPWKNFAWSGRLYYFSNFEFVNIEWENTFSFSFNKYVTAKLYLYPRFDDSSLKYRTTSGSYFMFKEWMSLGLEYKF